MRRLLLLTVLAVGCASTRAGSNAPLQAARERTDAAAAELRQIVPAGDSAVWHRVRKERLQTLLPAAMQRTGIDAWVVFVRENDNDPLAIHVAGENAGGTAAFLFLRSGDRVRAMALSPSGEAVALRDVGFHDEVITLERGDSVYARAAALLGEARRIAVNTSQRAAADGLSHTQYLAFAEALGERAANLVSSEELVIEFLSRKLPQEVEIMRRAAKVTALLEEEAYRTIEPGVTRDSDLARYLKRRMAELGVEDAWAPDQNPAVVSGADRGHTHATDRVIQGGDIIQTDFGIKVGGIWVTDIQRFAYVLRPGESAPPAVMVERFDNGKRGSRIALAAMKPGVRGYDIDRAQREWMKERGSAPVPWGTGHPVGYWAHDLGPALSGAQRDTPPSGDALRTLAPGQLFAFDGFFSWPIGENETKTISVEEMAVVTESGAEYLIAPQEELIVVP